MNKIENKQNDKPTVQTEQIKLGVFEEDDYFEEFNEEDMEEENQKNTIDFKQWQEDWEDEEINDHFDEILRKEIDAVSRK